MAPAKPQTTPKLLEEAVKALTTSLAAVVARLAPPTMAVAATPEVHRRQPISAANVADVADVMTQVPTMAVVERQEAAVTGMRDLVTETTTLPQTTEAAALDGEVCPILSHLTSWHSHPFPMHPFRILPHTLSHADCPRHRPSVSGHDVGLQLSSRFAAGRPPFDFPWIWGSRGVGPGGRGYW